MADFYHLTAHADGRTLEIIVPAERMKTGLLELFALAPHAMCWECRPTDSIELPRSA